MTPDLLVIGTSIDPHIGEVLRHLPEDFVICRLDVDRYPVDHDVSTYLSGLGPPRVELDGVDVSRAGVIWFRRLGAPGVDPRLSGPHAEFVRGEIEQYLSGVLPLLRPVQWINEYWSCRRASAKVWQYDVARRVGLQVPSTIVTSEPTKLMQFAASELDVAYKTLHAPIIDYGDRTTIVHTQRLGALAGETLDAVRAGPCQFQRYFEKAYEVRVTSIGAKHVAIKIDSQRSDDGKVDWRAADDLAYEQIDLPREVEDRLDALMRELQIEFGASDWIVTDDDDYIFLEVNPHGAWMWMEESLGRPLISIEIAKFIASAGA